MNVYGRAGDFVIKGVTAHSAASNDKAKKE
jgi:hypothetical protein